MLLPVYASLPNEVSRMPEETLTIDPEAWTVQVGDELIPLTYLEFRLLLFLAQHPGKVFHRRDLMRAVWAGERGSSDRSVDLYIHRLRGKLGEFGRRAIRTVVRVGYGFDLKGTDTIHVVRSLSGPSLTAESQPNGD